jgi:hypothetical protein
LIRLPLVSQRVTGELLEVVREEERGVDRGVEGRRKGWRGRRR